MDYKKSLTYNDIAEIPKLLEDFKLPEGLDKFYDSEFYLLGRGSSGNATIFAKYVWEMYCGIISNFIHPYSIFNSKKKMDFKNKIIWSFSQSGKSPDIVLCSKKIKEWGGKIIAVTNEKDIKKNKLAQISDFHILLSKSPEIPVAATKSFALQLWLILKVANLFGAKVTEKRFKKAIKQIKALIENFDKLYEKGNFSKLIKNSRMIGFAGRGPYNAIAEDSALKFREIISKHSAGYSAAEFLHGPIGAYGENDFVFLFSGTKKVEDCILDVLKKLKERKTKYKVIIPFYNDYLFNSLIVDIFFKLVAVRFACENEINPDTPKGLLKVTPTF